MNLFRGLTREQANEVRRCPLYFRMKAGEAIFDRGEPAFGLFAVVEGRVQIFDRDGETETPIAELGRGEVFGEMGLIAPDGRRTASARAIDDSTLIGIPGEPIDFFRRAGDPTVALKLLGNFIPFMAERLRGARAFDVDPPSISGEDLDRALAERGLPEGLLTHARADRGTLLFAEGSKSESLILSHSGRIETIHFGQGGRLRVIESIAAPAIVGDEAFFGGGTHKLGARAAEPAEYRSLDREAWMRLRRRRPEQAVELIFWLAQWIVARMVERQGRATA
jgi:CRP-like cAMP-binding protein